MATAFTLERTLPAKIYWKYLYENICSNSNNFKNAPRLSCWPQRLALPLLQPCSLLRCLPLCLILLLPVPPLTSYLVFPSATLPSLLAAPLSVPHSAPLAAVQPPCPLHLLDPHLFHTLSAYHALCLPHPSAYFFPLPHPAHSLQPRLTYVTSNGFLYFPFAIIAKNWISFFCRVAREEGEGDGAHLKNSQNCHVPLSVDCCKLLKSQSAERSERAAERKREKEWDKDIYREREREWNRHAVCYSLAPLLITLSTAHCESCGQITYTPRCRYIFQYMNEFVFLLSVS